MLLGQIVTSYGRRLSRPSATLSHPMGEGRGEGVMFADGEASVLASQLVGSLVPPTDNGAHGVTRPTCSPFVQLLEAVHEIEGLERIRFTSPHPKGYGDDLVEAYARLPKLVEHAHLPVQSGSNRVLKLMHRGYTRERFVGIVEKLRKVQPKIGITTDIIVGFPGETETDFDETLSLCREVEFDNAYLFKYSQRKDTPAASMPDQIPQEIIEDRHARVLELVNEIGKRKYDALVGHRTQILVEGPSKKNEARMMGRTRCNKIVVFDGSERHRGQIMDVKVTRTGSFTLYGDPATVNL
jgi:tRNA-2-methylthio-N6-dimethylallyladenosine synthase